MEHPFPTGTHVRNYGEQYSAALMHGTAVILSSKPSGRDGYEYEVQRDQALIPGTSHITWWSSTRTIPAREIDEPSVA